ncbi:MAG: hypothetical protein CM15mP44_4080 [Candidatus Neomarinimicrobiota bacterium]|nr:MAG: hypothetical protein CM15mP44_4080 [Candidatus Neomarinimicrobiota bacterium]
MKGHNLISFLIVLSILYGHNPKSNRKIEFPDLPGYKTLVCDLHMHSVFSDGSVWPDIRVQEAIRDGLDVIATTEHIEYQPWKDDIPHPDRNRSYEYHSNFAKIQMYWYLTVLKLQEICHLDMQMQYLLKTQTNLLQKTLLMHISKHANKMRLFLESPILG